MIVKPSINVKSETLVSDVMDAYPEARLLEGISFHDYGKKLSFHGEVATVKCHDDNSKVRQTLEGAGKRRVLVVDGTGGTRCSLFGGDLAKTARKNGWAGVIINGRIRDVGQHKKVPIGVKALGVCPRRAIKLNVGERDVPVEIAGVTISPGNYVCADGDGVAFLDEKPNFSPVRRSRLKRSGTKANPSL